MKYGLYVPNFGAFGDARLLGEMASTAEQSGWDGFFIWDQQLFNMPMNSGKTKEPLTLFSARLCHPGTKFSH
jgi:hypothetical protein